MEPLVQFLTRADQLLRLKVGILLQDYWVLLMLWQVDGHKLSLQELHQKSAPFYRPDQYNAFQRRVAKLAEWSFVSRRASRGREKDVCLLAQGETLLSRALTVMGTSS